MEKPDIADYIEAVPRNEQVVIEFVWCSEADQFKEWWEQEGWELFRKWNETPSEE